MSLVSELQQELTATYISISANVLFLFETSITFAQEVNVIWTRKWSMITWLYVVTRYTTLLLTILDLIPFSFEHPVSLTTRIAAVIGDLLVLAVTWLKTAQLYREARRLKIEASLATTLLHDGTVYFVILLIINVLQMLENNLPDVFFIQVSAPFLQTLPFVIVCRFILNLRQVKPTGETSTSGSSPAVTSSLRFVGNIGQSLHIGAGDEGDEITPTMEHLGISTPMPADDGVNGSGSLEDADIHTDPQV
ncbi:hypothetical protein BC629DRAFT_1595860 [Irpex lacteus]|nr:hypothetical protein BC629DRAFT_1595860 [Irpex lacteus]